MMSFEILKDMMLQRDDCMFLNSRLFGNDVYYNQANCIRGIELFIARCFSDANTGV